MACVASATMLPLSGQLGGQGPVLNNIGPPQYPSRIFDPAKRSWAVRQNAAHRIVPPQPEGTTGRFLTIPALLVARLEQPNFAPHALDYSKIARRRACADG